MTEVMNQPQNFTIYKTELDSLCLRGLIEGKFLKHVRMVLIL